ncbi:TIGR03668 family PPOX class F420-dependent oxidoreductase [Thermomicrobium sp. 4228-Ro]|uniref:TIGR03668 family PPOX class F420-dependent oxidoreductase n=1 Tax=Thermomicrobium sp. 4228-Ro TaxID=2993937 RepID=UPI0022489952|nr:TIGR03668 family PPOX class F420-dependent oxidoreductase [Thermomicrobium sp. 4228-Ro]MCX2728242.1 TIGR03668 family PPOX class F420-dependent oxidoreductase [Thermomicrobium sp. 4228-Ro]
MRELTPTIRAFLARQRVGHLATVDRAGDPHVVPVCYALGERTLYIPIDEKPKRTDRPLKRVRNVLETGRAAMVVDRYDEDWTRLGWVLLRGPAEFVHPGSPEQREAIALLRQRYPQYATMVLEERPVIALRIERVTAWGALD